ncbi:hypothetical protein HZA87_01220 [Candidatus Uhrbacteria bacterium]|nr:hypothetical protein [Candidatus Uhrbacteria bacterium]
MMPPQTPIPLRHLAQVSFRDQLTSQQGRKEVKPDLDFARQQRIAIVRLSNGSRIPAAIGLRTTVTKQTPSDSYVTDHWHVTISPFDNALLRRLHAKRNPHDAKGRVQLGAYDAPIPQALEARYDALAAIRQAHEPFSALCPTEGTVVEVTFAITQDLTRVMGYQASSTQFLRTLTSQAVNHNIREQEKYAAAHWPLKGPVRLLDRQFYPWWSVEPLHLWDVPALPLSDPWEPGGVYWEAIGDVVAREFAPILESLWKAAFFQDGEQGREGRAAVQLRAAGYDLDHLEATRMGVGPLRELMRENRRSGNLTQLGTPDLLEELGPEYIARLTHHGG